MTTYPLGQKVRLTPGLIADDTGLIDPNTLVLKVTRDDALIEMHPKTDLTRVGVGDFHFDYLPPVADHQAEYLWQFVGTSPAVAVRGSFIVDPSLEQILPLTVAQRSWLRAQLGSGSKPDDYDLAISLGRLDGSVAKVALEVWQGRYADFLRTPALLSVDRNIQNATANLDAVYKKVQQLTVMVRLEDEAAMRPGRGGYLRRPDRPERSLIGVSESVAYGSFTDGGTIL